MDKPNKANKVNIFNINIDKMSMDETVSRCINFLGDGSKHSVMTPNSEILLAATKDKGLFDALNKAAMIIPDGIGVVYASKILKNPVPERVAGYDLIMRLIKEISEGTYSIFLLGSSPGVAELAADNLKRDFPNMNIAGTHDGYFTDDESVINMINRTSPDILIVCLGFPKQEKWIIKNMDRINSRLFITGGGTLDVIAGIVKRAPAAFQKIGLEWLYRLIRQPSRAWRMTALPRFGLKVLFTRGKYKQR